jgi:hypothetical protein
VNPGLVPKGENEAGLIDEFIVWLGKETGLEFTLAERPDPPDGVLRSTAGDRVEWVEIARTFRSEDEAAYLNKRATGKPFGTITEPDAYLADAVIGVMSKKLEEKDYTSCVNKYGTRGHLLLAEADPLFDSRTLDSIRRKVAATRFPQDRGCFKAILLFVTTADGKSFERLPYCTSHERWGDRNAATES